MGNSRCVTGVSDQWNVKEKIALIGNKAAFLSATSTSVSPACNTSMVAGDQAGAQ